MICKGVGTKARVDAINAAWNRRTLERKCQHCNFNTINSAITFAKALICQRLDWLHLGNCNRKSSRQWSPELTMTESEKRCCRFREPGIYRRTEFLKDVSVDGHRKRTLQAVSIRHWKTSTGKQGGTASMVLFWTWFKPQWQSQTLTGTCRSGAKTTSKTLFSEYWKIPYKRLISRKSVVTLQVQCVKP